MQFDVMMKTTPGSSGGQTEQRSVTRSTESKFTRIFENHKSRIDEKNQGYKQDKVEEKKQRTSGTEKQEDSAVEEKKKMQKTSNKKDVSKYRDKDTEDANDTKNEDNVKEMEIRKKLMKLAKMLGIEPGEAAKLIMPSDFSNITNMQEKIEMLAAGLTGFLSIEENQKQELGENLKNIISEIFEGTKELKDYSGRKEKDINSEKIEELLKAVEQGTTLKEEAEVQSIRNTSNKDNVIDAKSGENEGTVSEYTEGTKQINNDSENGKTKNLNTQENAKNKDGSFKNAESETDTTAETKEIKDNKKNHEENNQDDTKGKEKKHSDWTDKIKVMFKYNEKNESIFRIPTDTNFQTLQNLQDAQAGEKVQTKVSSFSIPRRDEILNQIIDKAVVTLTPDKAEMTINLKPDHLGKLEMKLITEKGILNAQIVAENQQVKQIIESNFNVLRDALEKQGIAVQSFSVSVGDNNRNREFQNSGWKNQNNTQRNYKVNGIAVGQTGYMQDISSGNRIIWPDSTVNYTA